MITHEQFVAKCLDTWYSKMLDIPGFMFCRVARDTLHGLNLGPAATFGASCLWYLVLQMKNRATPVQACLGHY